MQKQAPWQRVKGLYTNMAHDSTEAPRRTNPFIPYPRDERGAIGGLLRGGWRVSWGHGHPQFAQWKKRAVIYFKCTKCGEGMEAPESMAGDAFVCPKCGLHERVPSIPPAAAPVSDKGTTPQPAVQTIELTSKRDKLGQLVGVVMIIVGMLLMIVPGILQVIGF